jgi:SAM-dependent methyltransferase
LNEPNRVRWVYSSRNNKELEERYDIWAEQYESDLARDFGYPGPEVIANLTERYVSKDGLLLDAGAGTGLVGFQLSLLGYSNIVGMDLSMGMLNEARKKNVYSELLQMVMGEHLDFPSDHFDAVVSFGVLTEGHAPASSLEELVRVTKPGGHIIYVLRTDLYEKNGFKEIQDSLETSGKWQLTELGNKFQTLPKGEPDLYSNTWVFTVTS